MKLTIETARNGYILRDDEGCTDVVSSDDPVTATFDMLNEVLEVLGHIGSRYDERRVRIIIERGDKWISPEEAQAIIDGI